MSVKTDLVTKPKKQRLQSETALWWGDQLKHKWNSLIFKMWKSCYKWYLKVVVWPLSIYFI